MTSRIGLELECGGSVWILPGEDETTVCIADPHDQEVTMTVTPADAVAMIGAIIQVDNGENHITSDDGLDVRICWTSDSSTGASTVMVQARDGSAELGPVHLMFDDKVALWRQLLDLLR